MVEEIAHIAKSQRLKCNKTKLNTMSKWALTLTLTKRRQNNSALYMFYVALRIDYSPHRCWEGIEM
jgi:hypothetical protein